MNSKNLDDLLIFLIQDQINEESSLIIKEIINIKNSNIKSNSPLNKSLIIKKLSNNKNQINIENIFEKLINLEFIEFNDTKKEELNININNIINILLYPRYCYYIANKYGPKCSKFFEYLLQFGLYQDDLNIFNKNEITCLIRDGVIIKNKIEKKENSGLFNCNNIDIYKINFKLMNEILFKEYIINYYKKYISMNFQFYDFFKKVIYSNNYIYQLKNYEKNINISQIIIDNFDFGNLLIKDSKDNNNDKLLLNKEMIKYDLFYNSIEKIINLFYSSKHARIFKIIQSNQNLNIFQISQKACLKYLEVQEILDDLIQKLKVIKKQDELYYLNDINKSIIDMIKNNIYGIIKNIKYELKDKLKELQGRIDQNIILQYINKYYSLINEFSEILNIYNFLFN